MFDIEKAIKEWKKHLRKRKFFEDGHIAELESHLRDEIDSLIDSGLTEKEAFELGIKKIGSPEEIGFEFYKLSGKRSLFFQKMSMRNALIGLLYNYYLTFKRNIKKSLGYSFLNILSLSVGIASFLLIFLWIENELSYDRYHKNRENLYRITFAEQTGDDYSHYAQCPYPAAPAFYSDLPEIIKYTRFESINEVIQYKNRSFDVEILHADSTFFEVFTHEFVYGNPKNALMSPSSIVLTENAAEKIFGKENPFGKILRVGDYGDLMVTGVIRNVPENSHFTFDYVVPLSNYPEDWIGLLNYWFGIRGYTYIVLRNNANPDELEKKFPSMVTKHCEQNPYDSGIEAEYSLQKLTDIHLKSHLKRELGKNGNIYHVYVFSTIAVFLLFIALINYINLSTARSVKRAREIGLRKVFGADRKELVFQFLYESIITSFIALILALIIVYYFLPVFGSIADVDIKFSKLLNLPKLLILTGFGFLTGIAAGSYPAFYQSSFLPSVIFKGKINTLMNRSTVRNVLVVFQFFISIVLIICTLMVIKQLYFMRNFDLGYDNSNMIVIHLPDDTLGNKEKLFKNELLRFDNILNVTFSTRIPGDINTFGNLIQEGKPDEERIRMNGISVDHDFVKTYGLEIIEGRDYSDKIHSDTSNIYIINSTFAEKLGWGNDAVGKTIGWTRDNMFEIAGIVKDFHLRSLKEPIGPFAMYLSTRNHYCMSIKVKPENISETITFIERQWRDFNIQRELRYFFADEHYSGLYNVESKIFTIIAVFSGLAIFVACIGLLGLAAYAAEQRIKEIGIRKVLGASCSKITAIMMKDFVLLVLAANIFAWPLGYFVINSWLQNFFYRTSINILPFIISGVTVCIIALLTVSYFSIKAAVANPVESIREE